MAELVLAKPPVRRLRQGSAQWLRPELRVRVKHLKAKGVLISLKIAIAGCVGNSLATSSLL